MDAIELLTTRSSCPRLTTPAPSAEHWKIMQQAALRAPDHAGLKPWQYLVFDNPKSQQLLGELMAQAAKLDDPTQSKEALEKIKSKPLRAPLVVACIAKCQSHPKVPRVEQVISAGCGVLAMQQAAFALGYGAVWRTGALCHSENMKQLLNLEPQDEIVGCLYIGTPESEVVIKPEKPIDSFFINYA